VTGAGLFMPVRNEFRVFLTALVIVVIGVVILLILRELAFRT